MKTVYLVRHAKSSWRDANLNDIDRPLKRKGINDAYEMAGRLAEKKIKPDLVISSPAARAVHTAIIFGRIMSESLSNIEINELIYNAGKTELLRVINGLGNKVNTVMIFGHDPTMTNFFNQFVKEKIDKIPTSGFIGLQFDTDEWNISTKTKVEISVVEFVRKSDKKK